MKLLITLLSIITGGYMIIDGIYVILKNKYIGPPKPGPWANLFYKFNVDVFKLGPLFIFFGVLWMIWLYALWTQQSWAFAFGITVCILTLWYLPVGTLFSIAVLLMIIFSRNKLAI